MQPNNLTKTVLLGMSRSELEQFVAARGIEKYRADQLFKGMYAQALENFDGLTTLSKKMRNELQQTAQIRTFKTLQATKSQKDGTTKFLWELSDGKTIESVIIYEGRRVTFCISSQVGCALDCKFCATGKMGFLRNLTSGEIVEQVLLMKERAERPPTNIVFMGMGEPLLNLRNVLKASEIIADPAGLSFARKKITISTSGVIPGIKKMADINAPWSLAISLNAVFEEKRREIMPVSIQYPLHELMKAIEYYVRRTGKRVTFEYILIGGVNDGEADAKRIIKMTARIPCKINLIPCNSTDPDFPPPTGEQIVRFNNYLLDNRKTSTVRMRKGWEIQAACGQLYSENRGKAGAKISFKSTNSIGKLPHKKET